MENTFTREEALQLLTKYNKQPFHLEHASTVEGVMGWYARELGYGEDEAFWRMVGLLHDIDFECYPEEHCKKAPELLAEINASPELIHAVCSHGYGLVSDVAPEHQMEKVLFAVDELTGLIGAGVLMRPSKTVMDMGADSVKRKFKDKHFAAGCSRDVIRQGAEGLAGSSKNYLKKPSLGCVTVKQRYVKNYRCWLRLLSNNSNVMGGETYALRAISANC